MSFKKMTIGKKITSGFDIVLALRALAGVIGYFGVGGILENAEKVIHGNKMDGSLAQREVYHLKWMNAISALLTDDKVVVISAR